MRKVFPLLSIIFLGFSCEPQSTSKEEQSSNKINSPTNEVGFSKDLNFIPLNPARGDQAPQSGAIFGNIREDVATGYIGKFKDGFKSPPHIHNITYRAIVMDGELHNADENAPTMWMPTGSVWTQPKGQPHITSAQGSNAMAYIEIDSGPYLVNPISESFDSDERPVNIHASNVIYLDANESQLIADNSNAQLAHIWEKCNGENGYILKLPAGSSGEIAAEGSVFFGIVISGGLEYLMPSSDATVSLDRGSHFKSQGKALHSFSVDEESLIYIRTNDLFSVK